MVSKGLVVQSQVSQPQGWKLTPIFRKRQPLSSCATLWHTSRHLDVFVQNRRRKPCPHTQEEGSMTRPNRTRLAPGPIGSRRRVRIWVQKQGPDVGSVEVSGRSLTNAENMCFFGEFLCPNGTTGRLTFRPEWDRPKIGRPPATFGVHSPIFQLKARSSSREVCKSMDASKRAWMGQSSVVGRMRQ